MRKVALIVVVGVGGAALGSFAWGDPLTVNPSMLNSTTALSAGSVTPSTDAQTNGPSLPATVVTPRQAMSSQMPSECLSCANAHFGTTIARTAPTDASHGVYYGAHLSTTLGAAGTIATAAQESEEPTTNVPSALQLSAVPNAQSLAATTPSDHKLGK